MATKAASTAGATIEWDLELNMFRPIGKNPDITQLVTTFAWDGMSAPGNEYWSGNYAGSLDPAVVCATSIAYTGAGFIMPDVYLPEKKFPEPFI
jgi:hypothetical protein